MRTILVAILSLAGSLALSSCQSASPPLDRLGGQWENSTLWRRGDGNPAVYYPASLSGSPRVDPGSSRWVIDPVDHAAFYIPDEPCGGLSSAMWRAEARKAMNETGKARQTMRDFAWDLFGGAAMELGLADPEADYKWGRSSGH